VNTTMLSDEEKREIEAEYSRYPTRTAAIIEALKIVQHHRGWVSDEMLKEVAAFMELPAAELEGVATYYSLIFRRPVGRHVILLCDSVSCWITGYGKLCEHAAKQWQLSPGQTSEDERFTLLPMPCLGACDRAPAMMVDEDLHGDLDTEKFDETLERYK
jgi:NADH-quinone oxidoreductase subunit E